MKNTYPENSPEARKELRRKKRRRRRLFRLTAVLTVLLLVLFLIALIVLKIVGNSAKKQGATTSFLAVGSIVVEGQTRYPADDIIKASGIYVGESLLAVNKVQAGDAILQQFPYLDQVEVYSASFSSIGIRVRETGILGVAQLSDGWMIVGENNHALEKVASDAIPPETVRFVGAIDNGTVGQADFLDERSLRICKTICEAAEHYGLEGIAEINVTEKTNLSLLWRDRITVQLGNETNLAVQIKALNRLLPTLIQNNGENAVGRLDMTSYADDNANNDKAVFTPGNIAPPAEPEPEETVSPTAA